MEKQKVFVRDTARADRSCQWCHSSTVFLDGLCRTCYRDVQRMSAMAANDSSATKEK